MKIAKILKVVGFLLTTGGILFIAMGTEKINYSAFGNVTIQMVDYRLYKEIAEYCSFLIIAGIFLIIGAEFYITD